MRDRLGLARDGWGDDQSPIGRGKSGMKRSLLTEGHGVPLGLAIEGANRHDLKLVRPTIESIVLERPEPTKRLGKYELQERLGQGGMAEIWKALDPQLKRYVAIKFLHTKLSADPEFMTRFVREGQAIASLRHPNIVQVYDFQMASPQGDGPTAYRIMDYIMGQTLADYIRKTSAVRNFPSASEFVNLFTPISLAVDYAHQHGIIHRDIKPANILLDSRNTLHNAMGEPILTDFGIVKMLGEATLTTAMTASLAQAIAVPVPLSISRSVSLHNTGQNAPLPASVPSRPAARRRKGLIAILGAVLLVLIIGSGLGVFLFSYKGSPSNPTATELVSTVFMESGGDATKDFTFWDSASAGGVDCTVSKTGPCSIKFTSGASQTTDSIKKAAILADAGRRMSFYFKFDSFLSVNHEIVELWDRDFKHFILSFAVQASSHKLYIQSSSHLGSTVLQTGTWYRMSFAYTITSTSVNEWRLYLNGTQEVSASNLSLSRIGSSAMRLGINDTNGGANVVSHMDDFYIDDSNALTDTGDIHVTNKRPNANGAANNFATRIGTGGSGYGSGHSPQVNEQPLSTTNGWKTASTRTSENYNIEGAATGDVDISTARYIANSAWIYASYTQSAGGSSCTGAQITNNGRSAGFTLSTGITLTTTNTLFTNNTSISTYPSNPATVGMVSCSSVNKVSSMNLYEAGMLIAYDGS